jgi:hypothetical protein
MITDKKLFFSEKQAVTTTAASTHTVDTGAPDSKIGDGTPVRLNIAVDTAFTGQGATTLKAALQDSADNSSFADVIVTDAIDEAELIEGKAILKVPLPNGLRRYIRLNYTVGSGPFTAGPVSSFLSLASE